MPNSEKAGLIIKTVNTAKDKKKATAKTLADRFNEKWFAKNVEDIKAAIIGTLLAQGTISEKSVSENLETLQIERAETTKTSLDIYEYGERVAVHTDKKGNVEAYKAASAFMEKVSDLLNLRHFYREFWISAEGPFENDRHTTKDYAAVVYGSIVEFAQLALPKLNENLLSHSLKADVRFIESLDKSRKR